MTGFRAAIDGAVWAGEMRATRRPLECRHPVGRQPGKQATARLYVGQVADTTVQQSICPIATHIQSLPAPATHPPSKTVENLTVSKANGYGVSVSLKLQFQCHFLCQNPVPVTGTMRPGRRPRSPSRRWPKRRRMDEEIVHDREDTAGGDRLSRLSQATLHINESLDFDTVLSGGGERRPGPDRLPLRGHNHPGRAGPRTSSSRDRRRRSTGSLRTSCPTACWYTGT